MFLRISIKIYTVFFTRSRNFNSTCNRHRPFQYEFDVSRWYCWPEMYGIAVLQIFVISLFEIRRIIKPKRDFTSLGYANSRKKIRIATRRKLVHEKQKWHSTRKITYSTFLYTFVGWVEKLRAEQCLGKPKSKKVIGEFRLQLWFRPCNPSSPPPKL